MSCAVGLRQAQRYTRRLALSHYENFLVGGVLTPRRLRQDFYNLYAYCREADDLADEIGSDVASLERLEQWRRWLCAIYAGDDPPPHPVFVALRPTVRRFGIPREPFLELIEAFVQDQRVKQYATFDELLAYCRRSANPVGHLVLCLGGCFDAERAALADHVCTGLQLANFCQDVRRDAKIGRIYLPDEDLARYGVDTSRMDSDAPPPGAVDMMRAQVDRAEVYLRDGLPLADRVPRWLGRNVRMFIGGGLAILAKIREAEYDVWTRRPVLGPMARAKLVWEALGG